MILCSDPFEAYRRVFPTLTLRHTRTQLHPEFPSQLAVYAITYERNPISLSERNSLCSFSFWDGNTRLARPLIDKLVIVRVQLRGFTQSWQTPLRVLPKRPSPSTVPLPSLCFLLSTNACLSTSPTSAFESHQKYSVFSLSFSASS